MNDSLSVREKGDNVEVEVLVCPRRGDLTQHDCQRQTAHRGRRHPQQHCCVFLRLCRCKGNAPTEVLKDRTSEKKVPSPHQRSKNKKKEQMANGKVVFSQLDKNKNQGTNDAQNVHATLTSAKEHAQFFFSGESKGTNERVRALTPFS